VHFTGARAPKENRSKFVLISFCSSLTSSPISV
jgi:hypothetical protein